MPADLTDLLADHRAHVETASEDGLVLFMEYADVALALNAVAEVANRLLNEMGWEGHPLNRTLDHLHVVLQAKMGDTDA